MRNEAGERINSGKSGVRHGDLSPGWGANVGPRGDESAVAAGFRAVKRVNHIAARTLQPLRQLEPELRQTNSQSPMRSKPPGCAAGRFCLCL